MALQTTILNEDARLKSFVGDVYGGTPYGTLMRFWPNIDATLAEGLIDGINVLNSVKDPKADGVVYPGLFYGLKPIAFADSDRSVTITQTLVYSRTWAVAVSGANIDEIKEKNVEPRFHGYIRSWFNIRSIDATTARTQLLQGGAYGNIAEFQVTQVDVRNKGDGTFDVSQTIEQCRSVLAAPDLIEPLEVGSRHAGVTNTYFSYNKTVTDAALVSLGAAQTGKFVSVRANPHGNEIYDIIQEVRGDGFNWISDKWIIGPIDSGTLYYEKEFLYKGDLVRELQGYLVQVAGHASQAAADNAIYGALMTTPVGGSHVDKINDSWYISTRVTRNTGPSFTKVTVTV